MPPTKKFTEDLVEAFSDQRIIDALCKALSASVDLLVKKVDHLEEVQRKHQDLIESLKDEKPELKASINVLETNSRRNYLIIKRIPDKSFAGTGTPSEDLWGDQIIPPPSNSADDSGARHHDSTTHVSERNILSCQRTDITLHYIIGISNATYT